MPVLEATSVVFPPPAIATAFLDKLLIGVVIDKVSVTVKSNVSDDASVLASVNVGVNVARLF